MATYLLAFAAAAASSALLTYLQIRLAHRRGWLDYPSERRIHIHPTPRIGGVGMYLAFSAVILALTLAGALDTYIATGILLGVTSLVLVGLADDLWGVSAGPKFLYQLAAAAMIVVAFGVSVGTITLPVWGTLYFEQTLAGYAFTIFWIVGMINTVNFADGIDGLASGLAAIFALVVFVIGLRLGQEELALYACVLGGTALGFLGFNFSPARIFMGDSGSMFLGFTMGVLSILGSAKLATALLIMGVPIVDVAYSILRRVRSGVPIHMPDKAHLHHRFLNLGLSQRATCFFFYALALGFGSAGLIEQRLGRMLALAGLAVLAVAVIWWVNRRLDLAAARVTDSSLRSE